MMFVFFVALVYQWQFFLQATAHEVFKLISHILQQVCHYIVTLTCNTQVNVYVALASLLTSDSHKVSVALRMSCTMKIR